MSFLIHFKERSRDLLQTATSGAESSQVLRFGLSFPSLALPPELFPLLFLNEESPPAGERVASLSKDALHDFVDINSSTFHPLEGSPFQGCRERRGTSDLENCLLLRSMLCEEWMSQYIG
jgi:hypothetical protein